MLDLFCLIEKFAIACIAHNLVSVSVRFEVHLDFFTHRVRIRISFIERDISNLWLLYVFCLSNVQFRKILLDQYLRRHVLMLIRSNVIVCMNSRLSLSMILIESRRRRDVYVNALKNSDDKRDYRFSSLFWKTRRTVETISCSVSSMMKWSSLCVIVKMHNRRLSCIVTDVCDRSDASFVVVFRSTCRRFLFEFVWQEWIECQWRFVLNRLVESKWIHKLSHLTFFLEMLWNYSSVIEWWRNDLIIDQDCSCLQDDISELFSSFDWFVSIVRSFANDMLWNRADLCLIDQRLFFTARSEISNFYQILLSWEDLSRLVQVELIRLMLSLSLFRLFCQRWELFSWKTCKLSILLSRICSFERLKALR
jgi:hypothetical protein